MMRGTTGVPERVTRRTAGGSAAATGVAVALLLLGGPAGGAAQADPVDPAARMAELESRLLDARRAALDFRVTAEGAAAIEVAGHLRREEGGGVELRAEGTFGGRTVDLLLRTEGDRYEFGNGPERATAPVPPALWEALVLGFTRMGVLHNLARLSGNAPPDHAEGGVGEWVVVDGFDHADDALTFDITVAGQPSGSASLELGLDGLPHLRRQSVRFPNGEMRVVERYTEVTVGAGGSSGR